MNKYTIASTDKNAGKTSVVVGLGQSLGKSCGYVKPFGDRLFYRKKRLWDYDSAVVANALNISENPEDISLGFDHTKLRYMYDEKKTKEKLDEIIKHAGKDKDVLFIECGNDLSFGSSVYLDAISVSKCTNSKLVIVVSGNEETVIDEAVFIKKYVNIAGCDFAGIIINKVNDIDDFNVAHGEALKKIGVPILGIVPYKDELADVSIAFLVEYLFAKVISGENNLNNYAKNILVGAMSVDALLRTPLFKAESKLIITSGDRSDMIVAAIENNAVGIVLTNNILPPANIISKAEDKNIPMLLVSTDTFKTAKKIDDVEPLLMKKNDKRLGLLKEIMSKHVSNFI